MNRPLFDALRAETYKVRRRRMTYILLGAGVFLVTLFYVALWLGLRQGPGDKPEDVVRYLGLREGMAFKNVVPAGYQLERFFATILSVVFAGTMTGNEYDWRTIGVALSRGVRRWHFLFAKVVTAVAFCFLCVGICFLTAAVLSAWFSHLYALDFGGLTGPRLWNALASGARTSFVILPFVFMALLLAVFLRSAAQAVGATLGVYIVETIFTSLLNNAKGFLGDIPKGLLNINGDILMRANGFVTRSDGPFFTPDAPDPTWRALLVLGLWIGLFGAYAFYRFNRRDIQE